MSALLAWVVLAALQDVPPQVEADARQVWAIDQKVAELKGQAARREITAAEYTARVQELTKARLDITNRYPRGNPNLKAFLDRYNALKAEQAKADAEARQKAALEAQAKAAEEKRKADAERARLAAEKDAQKAELEKDAEEYARLQIRATEINTKAMARTVTAEENAELQKIAVRASELLSKHLAPGTAQNPLPGLAGQAQAKIQNEPGFRDRQTAALFPSPAQVAADYPDPVKRGAALEILRYTLNQNARINTPQWHAYKEAQEALAVELRSKGVMVPAAGLTEAQRSLAADLEFHKEVVARYVPMFGGFVIQKIEEREERAAGERFAIFALPLLVLTGVVMILAIYAVARIAGSLAPKGFLPGGGPLDLPPELAVVRVPGKQYPCTATFGLVIDKEIGIEHHVTVTTTTSTSTTSPGYSTTTVRDEAYQKDVVWYRTLDGGEGSWTFRYGTFKVRPSQVVSTVTADDGIVMVLNHTTGQFLSYDPAIDAANTLSCKRSAWMTASVIGGLGILGSSIITAGTLARGSGWITGTLFAALPAMLVSSILTGVIAWRYTRRMRARFRKDYFPALQAFLEKSTPAALKHFGQ